MEESKNMVDQRVAALERQYVELTTKVDRVSIEQTYQRELIIARFTVMEKSQDMLLTKFDALVSSIASMSSDSGASASGRALFREIKDVEASCSAYAVTVTRDFLKLETEVEAIQKDAHEVRGAIKLLKTIGISALLTGLIAFATVISRMLKILP